MNEKWIKVSQDDVYIRADRIDAVRIAENAVQGYEQEPTVYYRLQALVGGEWITVNSYRSNEEYSGDFYKSVTAENAAKNDLISLLHEITLSFARLDCDEKLGRKDDKP